MILSTWGVCMPGGHAWLWGTCVVVEGVCVVVGGMHGCWGDVHGCWGGHA